MLSCACPTYPKFWMLIVKAVKPEELLLRTVSTPESPQATVDVEQLD